MSWASSEVVRRNMQAIRRRDTKTELAVRRLLHRAGFRFRVDFAPVNKRRRADVVFTKRRVAIFIDGCFWHGCAEHYVPPKSNGEYWGPKVQRNMARDAETSAQLTEHGWHVLRYWEHEGPERIAAHVLEELATLEAIQDAAPHQ